MDHQVGDVVEWRIGEGCTLLLLVKDPKVDSRTGELGFHGEVVGYGAGSYRPRIGTGYGTSIPGPDSQIIRVLDPEEAAAALDGYTGPQRYKGATRSEIREQRRQRREADRESRQTGIPHRPTAGMYRGGPLGTSTSPT